jgi:O-antigen/teichoic acid export membrane protein
MGTEVTVRDTGLKSTMKTMLGGRFAGGFASTLLAQVGLLGLGTFTSVASARLLGPQGRGELAAVILWPLLLVMLFSLGINQATVFHTGQRRHSIPEVWTASTLITLVQSLCVVLVGLVVIPVALHRYSPEVRHLALIFLFATPLLPMLGCPGNLLQGRLDFFSFNVIRTTPPLVYALGLAVLLLLRRADLWDLGRWVFDPPPERGTAVFFEKGCVQVIAGLRVEESVGHRHFLYQPTR